MTPETSSDLTLRGDVLIATIQARPRVVAAGEAEHAMDSQLATEDARL